MSRRSCGLWYAQAGFRAVVLDDGSPRHRTPILVPGTPAAVTHFCRWLADLDADLVAPSDLPVRALIDQSARAAGLRYHVAPAPLVSSLCLVAAVPARSGARAAALVARLPGLPYFRALLRLPASVQPCLF